MRPCSGSSRVSTIRGRLSVRFEGPKKAGLAQSPLSNDQDMRAQSIMAAFMRMATSLDVDVNLSREGTRFGRVVVRPGPAGR
jgi:hypothetical protein